jgi:hypothetical protein
MSDVIKAETPPKSADPIDPYSCHPGADGLTYRNAVWLEAVQAEDVDSEVVGSDPLAMKWIDATGFAEEVASCHRVETILGERVLPREQFEPGLVDLHH